MTPPPEPVRAFALARGTADTHRIVGYGMVLPDGSAASVSWPPVTGFSFSRQAAPRRTPSCVALT